MILIGCTANNNAGNSAVNTQIANPASVYCKEQGGTLTIVTAADGSQTGMCTLKDGTKCEEWAYYRHECPFIKCSDPQCIAKNFPTCTPAKAEMNGDNKDETIVISIHGFENEKCRYSMVMNGIVAVNCSFKKEELTSKVLNQMFGNKEGQDSIIAEACK